MFNSTSFRSTVRGCGKIQAALSTAFRPQGGRVAKPRVGRVFAAYPGSSVCGMPTLKGLCTAPNTQPFPGWGCGTSRPRVGRKSAANPGLCSATPLGSKCGRPSFLPVPSPHASVLLVIAVLALLGSSCGYRTASATRSLKGQSIAVVPLVNKTTTFEVEQILTRAVVRSLIERSSYRIVQDPSQADVVLRGEILSVMATPVIFGRETFGTAFLVALNAKVELKDRRTGKLLFKNDNYLFREQYEINADVKSFFSELNPALERIAADFGSSVVSTVLEDF